MTVLVLSHMFPNQHDPTGGIFVFEQIRALRCLGVRIITVAPTPWAPRQLRFWWRVRKYADIPPKSEIDGFTIEHPRVLALPGGYEFCIAGFLYYARCRRVVRAYMKKSKLDLIHAHAIMPDGFAAVLLGREFKLPVVCTAHGSDIRVYPQRGRLIRWATRWALRRVGHLVAVSDDLRQRIFELIGSKPVELIPNGADVEIFRAMDKAQARAKLKLPGDKKIICFVGYLRPEKGVNYLLDALAHSITPDTLLCLVGDGSVRTTLEAAAERLGVRNRCMFAGKRPHDEISVWLSAADCLVLPSLSEGLPTILPEAMACRVPIVATAVGGSPEVIRDGDTGLLVPPADPIALGKAINRILEDPEFASAMAQRAETAAQRNLSWKTNAERTAAVYRSALLGAHADMVVSDSQLQGSSAS